MRCEKSDEGESPTAPLEGQVEVTLCQVGQPRRKVAIDPLWSVRELKENLFPEEVENKKLIRVIFSGKRLKDPDFLKDFGVKEGVFIHISITDAIDPGMNFALIFCASVRVHFLRKRPKRSVC